MRKKKRLIGRIAWGGRNTGPMKVKMRKKKEDRQKIRGCLAHETGTGREKGKETSL